MKSVARQLGNSPVTCREYYVHPAILDAFADGYLFETMAQGREENAVYEGRGLRPDEYAVLVIIAKHPERVAKAA
jgi:DNA topoisomerase I